MSRTYSRTAAGVAALATAVTGLMASPAEAAQADSPWQTFTTTRADLAPDGSQAVGGHSFFPSISGTGRYVAYRTGAANAGGANRTVVRDAVTGTTEQVVVRPDGGPSMGSQIFRTSVSADGRYVAFCSMAGDLVNPPLAPFRAVRVFVRDTLLGTTTHASLDANGNEFPADAGPAILSGDGRSAAFVSNANVYVRRLNTSTTVKASIAPPGENWWWDRAGGAPSLSHDGRYVAFAYQSGLYVRDLESGVTVLASRTAAGGFASGSEADLSADGRFLTFVSSDAGLADGASTGPQIYRRDLAAGTNVRVSASAQGDAGTAESSDPSISGDGRYVTFASSAPNLVTGDTNNDRDVFVRDVETGTTTRLSVGPSGEQANRPLGWVEPLISQDGRAVVFSSIAFNLVAGDTNGFEDVFVATVS
jgi:Tol biopolymer transport system component